MINKIAVAIAFLLGAVITHTHWYQVNLRLQRFHKRQQDRLFSRTYEGAYADGLRDGRWAAQLDDLLGRVPQH